MDAKKRIRAKVIAEIVSTEETYVRGLRELGQELKALEKLGESPEGRPIKQVTVGLDQIHKLQDDFLTKLKVELRKANGIEGEELNNDNEPLALYGASAEVEAVSKHFIVYAKFFKLYTTYMANYYKANDLICKSKKAASLINEQYQRGERSSNILRKFRHSSSNDAGIASLMAKLISPIQRIPRYVLLLKELLRRSRELSHAKISLITALKMVENVAQDLNAAIEQRNRDVQMLKLKNLFVDADDMDLLAPHRVLQRTADCWLKADSKQAGKELEAKAILLNDIIIVATKCPKFLAYVDVCIFAGRNLSQGENGLLASPYAKVVLEEHHHSKHTISLGKTEVMTDEPNPQWRRKTEPPVYGATFFDLMVSGYGKDFPEICIDVRDKHKDRCMGCVRFNLAHFTNPRNNDRDKIYKVQSLRWHSLKREIEPSSRSKIFQMLPPPDSSSMIASSSSSSSSSSLGEVKVKVEMVYVTTCGEAGDSSSNDLEEEEIDDQDDGTALIAAAKAGQHQKFAEESRKILGYGEARFGRVKHRLECTSSGRVRKTHRRRVSRGGVRRVSLGGGLGGGGGGGGGDEEKIGNDDGCYCEYGRVRVGGCTVEVTATTGGESNGAGKAKSSSSSQTGDAAVEMHLINKEIQGRISGRLRLVRFPREEARFWRTSIHEHALLDATKASNVRMMQRYLKVLKVDPDTPTTRYKYASPLTISVLSGNVDATHQLLKAKASVNMADRSGLTVLMKAARQRSTTPSLIKLLLMKKADPELEDAHGHTAWDLACEDLQKYLPRGGSGPTLRGRRPRDRMDQIHLAAKFLELAVDKPEE